LRRSGRCSAKFYAALTALRLRVSKLSLDGLMVPSLFVE